MYFKTLLSLILIGIMSSSCSNDFDDFSADTKKKHDLRYEFYKLTVSMIEKPYKLRKKNNKAYGKVVAKLQSENLTQKMRSTQGDAMSFWEDSWGLSINNKRLTKLIIDNQEYFTSDQFKLDITNDLESLNDGEKKWSGFFSWAGDLLDAHPCISMYLDLADATIYGVFVPTTGGYAAIGVGMSLASSIENMDDCLSSS